MGAPTSHFVVVVDIESFSGRSDPVQQSLRRAMYEVLKTAVDDAHLAWADFHPQDRGDGVIMLVGGHVSPVSLAGELVRALESGLAEKATVYNADHQMRFRVALHQGLASPDDEGWSGDAVNTACRLVDAQPLRDTLAEARRAHVALIVSDSFFQSVIRPGHRSIDPSTFVPVTLTIKNLVDFKAWIRVPGYAAPPKLPRAERTRTTSPSRPPDESGQAGTSSITINGNVKGDAVARDKHVHGQR